MSRQVIDVRPYVGQQVAMDWVRDKYGLDPKRITADGVIIVDTDARTVTYEEFEFGEDGKAIIGEGDQVIRRTVTKHFDEPIPEWP